MGWFRFLKILATTILGRWDLTWAVFHYKCLFSLFTKGDFLGLLCDSVASLKVYHTSRVWFHMLKMLILYQKYLCHMCNLSLMKDIRYRLHTLMFFNGWFQWQIRTIFVIVKLIATCLATLYYVTLKKILWLLKHSMKIQSQYQVILKIFSFCFIIPTVKWNKVCFLLRPSENAKAKIFLFWFCFIHCYFHNEKFKGLSVCDTLQGLMASESLNLLMRIPIEEDASVSKQGKQTGE